MRFLGERLRADASYTGRQKFEATGDSEGSIVERHPDAVVHFSIIGEGRCKACGCILHAFKDVRGNILRDVWTDDSEIYDNHSKRCNYAYKAGD